MADAKQSIGIPLDLSQPAPVTTPTVPAAAAASFHETKTSITVFRRYLVRSQSSSGEALVDASSINSKACYDEWQVPNPTPY